MNIASVVLVRAARCPGQCVTCTVHFDGWAFGEEVVAVPVAPPPLPRRWHDDAESAAPFVSFSSAAALVFAAPTMSVINLDLRGMRNLELAQSVWVAGTIERHWPDILRILVAPDADARAVEGLLQRFGTRIEIL